ncbi:hypothetical protein PINS_up010280 [Pythium insidiosum]|nr:hypothetical protein PINS_up010280 [Pythium insidiosum]
MLRRLSTTVLTGIRPRATLALSRRLHVPTVSARWTASTRSRWISTTRPLCQQQRGPGRWFRLRLTERDEDTIANVLVVLAFGCPSVYFLLSRRSPLGVFNESMDLLSKHPEVTSRLGEPVCGYGEDYELPGRRHTFKRSKHTDVDGHVHSRLKYNIKGPNGHATVYVETIEGAPKHDYVYLIVEFTELNEVVKIVDNRKDGAAMQQRDFYDDKSNDH